MCPGRRRIRRVSTITRAISPTRPGSAAFPSNPTQNAENTVLLPWMRRRHRLVDDDLPGARTNDHRREVDEHGGGHPGPCHQGERIAQQLEVRAVPDHEGDDADDRQACKQGANQTALGQPGPHAATASRRATPTSSS